MSPDEAMVTISYAAADRARAELDNLLASDQPFRPEAQAMLRRYADEIRAACAARRASGEGGSTSALRASAPEGEDDARRALRELVACKALKDKVDALNHERDRHAEWLAAFNEYRGRKEKAWTEARIVLANPPGVSWRAPSDGAAAPLAPEGQDALHFYDGCPISPDDVAKPEGATMGEARLWENRYDKAEAALKVAIAIVARLKEALEGCIESLAYVNKAHPEATGSWVRHVRITKAQALLDELKA